MPQEIISLVSQLSLFEMGAPFALTVIVFGFWMVKIALGR
jgi:hypothetical protein